MHSLLLIIKAIDDNFFKRDQEYVGLGPCDDGRFGRKEKGSNTLKGFQLNIIYIMRRGEVEEIHIRRQKKKPTATVQREYYSTAATTDTSIEQTKREI
ncbi:hypothetical protein HanIR_Chr02g0082821 [Helianthus annuus]|nr:hypothetical protein HanIR_Chr02g0082821 [Helianthus annuus]